jgi:hypothetical protein
VARNKSSKSFQKRVVQRLLQKEHPSPKQGPLSPGPNLMFSWSNPRPTSMSYKWHPTRGECKITLTNGRPPCGCYKKRLKRTVITLQLLTLHWLLEIFFESFSMVYLRQLFTSSQHLPRLNPHTILVPVTFRNVYHVSFSVFHAPIPPKRKITDISVCESAEVVER